MRVVGARDLRAEVPDEQREDSSKYRHRDIVHEVTIRHRRKLCIPSETHQKSLRNARHLTPPIAKDNLLLQEYEMNVSRIKVQRRCFPGGFGRMPH